MAFSGVRYNPSRNVLAQPSVGSDTRYQFGSSNVDYRGGLANNRDQIVAGNTFGNGLFNNGYDNVNDLRTVYADRGDYRLVDGGSFGFDPRLDNFNGYYANEYVDPYYINGYDDYGVVYDGYNNNRYYDNRYNNNRRGRFNRPNGRRPNYNHRR